MEKYSPRDVTDSAALPTLAVIVVGRSVPHISSRRGGRCAYPITRTIRSSRHICCRRGPEQVIGQLWQNRLYAKTEPSQDTIQHPTIIP